MANIFRKTMREALQEAREYRDVAKEGGPGSGPQKGNPGSKYSDKQIKQAYGILNDPRYKQGNYSGAAKAIDKLAKGLSSHPDVKNALKRANEGLDLPTTGDTTTSNASQEIEEAADKSSAEYKAGLAAAEKGEKYDTNPHAPGRNRLNWSMGHNQFRADALRKAGKPNYGARGQFEDTEVDEDLAAVAKKVGGALIKPFLKKDNFPKLSDPRTLRNVSGNPHKDMGVRTAADRYTSVSRDSGRKNPSKAAYIHTRRQGMKEETDIEGEELSEAWRESLVKGALADYRKVYNTMKNKVGIQSHFIKQMEKFYDDLVIGGMYSSRGAEEAGILKIDGRTKYKNQNW